MLEAKSQRLLDLYLDRKISKEEFTSRRTQLERTLKDLDHALDRRPVDVKEMQERIRSHVTRFCERARKRFDSLRPDELQHFLRLLIDEISYDSEHRRAMIRGHIPSSLGALHMAAGLSGAEMPVNWADAVRFEVSAKV